MFDIERARQTEELAAQCLSDLCHAKRRWEMHIPLQNDDPDVILGDALGQLRSAIKEIERHRAEAAEARVVNWISAEDRLPETQLRVLAVMLYDGRKPRIIRAMHIPAKTVECLDWEFNDAVVYDSESERHYFGAGWYELMEEGEYDYVGPLSDSVTHWAEMPELPEYFRQ